MSDESLFREVDEDVRRDQLSKLWARYGKAVIAVSFGIIAAVAGIKGYEYFQLRQSENAARAYFAAAKLENDGNSAEAAKAFAAAASGQAGFAALAQMRAAANLAASGDNAGAVKAYDSLASGADPLLAETARIRAAWLLVDTASPADLEKRLAGLNTPENAWRNAAREILGLAHYKAGDLAKADALFNELLADPEAPATARSRAQLLIQVLAPRLGAKNAG